MTLQEWAQMKMEQGHEVKVLISDRTDNETFETTLDPMVMADWAFAKNVKPVTLRH